MSKSLSHLTKLSYEKQNDSDYQTQSEESGRDGFQESIDTFISQSQCGFEEAYSDDEDHVTTHSASDVKLMIGALEKSEGNRKYGTIYGEKKRDIERRNAVLMDKIISQSRRPSQYNIASPPKVNYVPSASINRRQAQKKIDHENLILLRKIQSVKPFGLSRPRR